MPNKSTDVSGPEVSDEKSRRNAVDNRETQSNLDIHVIKALQNADKTALRMTRAYIQNQIDNDPSIDLDILDQQLDAIPRIDDSKPFISLSVEKTQTRDMIVRINLALFAYCLISERFLDVACNAFLDCIVPYFGHLTGELLQTFIDTRDYVVKMKIFERSEAVEEGAEFYVQDLLNEAFPINKGDYPQKTDSNTIDQLIKLSGTYRENFSKFKEVADIEPSKSTLKKLQNEWWKRLRPVMDKLPKSELNFDSDEYKALEEENDDPDDELLNGPADEDQDLDEQDGILPSSSAMPYKAPRRRKLPVNNIRGAIMSGQSDAHRLTSEEFGDLPHERQLPVPKTDNMLRKRHTWWSAEEEEALRDGLKRVKGPLWKQIREMKLEVLQNRTNVQIKDKARTELQRRQKEGLPLEEYEVLLREPIDRSRHS